MVESTAVVTEQNLELLRRGYKAFSSGDMDTLRSEIFQPDIVWHQGGDNPTSGDYRGAEQVLGLFGNLFQSTDGTFTARIDRAEASDDLVMAIGVSTASRKGRSINEPYTHVCRVRDGKLAEAWIINLNQPVIDAFFSS